MYIKGFTLVELVTIILILSIVGMVIFSRYTSPSAFNPMAARDAALTTARAAQQLGRGRDGVTFRVIPAGGSWRFEARSGSTVLRDSQVPAAGYSLTTGSVAAGGSCSSLNTPLDGFTVSYDGRGNLARFENGAIDETVGAGFNGVRLCVSSNPEFSLCISPNGFAHLGDCSE